MVSGLTQQGVAKACQEIEWLVKSQQCNWNSPRVGLGGLGNKTIGWGAGGPRNMLKH